MNVMSSLGVLYAIWPENGLVLAYVQHPSLNDR